MHILNRVVVLVGITLLLIVGCTKGFDGSFTQIESERTKLIGGLDSYSSFSEVKSKLRLSDKAVKTIENGRRSAEGRPPFKFRVVAFDYTHLDYRGRLEITFFNDRLMSTKFYPEKADQYIARLKSKLNRKFDTKRQAHLPPFTSLWLGRDVQGRKFILWEDVRLQEQVNDWIERYS